jgi:hypothetical protein
MSVRKLTVLAMVALFVFALTACGSGKASPEATSVTTLGESLKAAEMRVQGPNPNDVLSSRFVSVPGVQYVASGETVYAYEFETDEELTAQRALVSPDGYGIGLKYVNWSVAPSFYQKGRLIVIYDGKAQLMLDTLVAAMGERFAGSDPE